MSRLHDGAEGALDAMRAGGFEHAQVSLRHTALTEVNLTNNEASLLRSHEKAQLALVGVVGQRKASTLLDATTLADGTALREAVARLRSDAEAAPVDEAHAVSAGQRAEIVQGPQQAELDPLVDTARELLAWRAEHAPAFLLGEGTVSHRLQQTATLTSGGSVLQSSVGCYDISAFGSARDGQRVSSFTYAGGSAEALHGEASIRAFGIDDMMREALASLDARPLGRKCTGDLILTPMAVESLLEWLLLQLGDERLISRTSIYGDRVGQPIAVPGFTLRSRFDGPGITPVSSDAFIAPAVQPVQQGVLTTLLPSLYASRRTGLPHVPTAERGWCIDAGNAPRAALTAGVDAGAVVGRFSMGRPAVNGDFSAVIKNGFVIENGQPGQALAETMVAGNMAQMLQSITAISRERLDTGSSVLPWIRVAGMHFS